MRALCFMGHQEVNLAPFALEDLIGMPAPRSAGKRGPAPKLQQQLEQLGRLPKAKQRAIAQVLDSMLANQP